MNDKDWGIIKHIMEEDLQSDCSAMEGRGIEIRTKFACTKI